MKIIDIRSLKIDKPLTRTFTFDRSKIDVEKRTVPVAFSSEEPVERWFGMEILDHSPQAADLSRLNDGHPLLFNHNMNMHLGTIEPKSAIIDSDKKGRAVVRFGSSPLAQEKFQDVQDGILTKISFAYDPIEMVLEATEKGGPDIYRVTKWLAYEISFVTIPADNTVGAGRNLDITNPKGIALTKKEEHMEKCTKCGASLVNGVCPVCAETERTAAAAAATREQNEKTRKEEAKEIRALAAKYDCADLALEYISEGRSLSDFKGAILEKKFKAQPAKPIDTTLSQKEQQQYSIIRAIKVAAFGGDGLEREISDEIGKKLNRSSKGIFIPMSLRAPLVAGTPASGGDLIPSVLMPLIDILRNKMLTRQMGAQVLSGLTGNVAFPRQTGTTTLYWVGENPVSDTGESESAFEQLILTPKTAQATTAYSRQLLQQSSTDIDNFVRNDLMQVNAVGIDSACINGTGQNNQPTGILATLNIGVVVGGDNGALPTWTHVVALESKVSTANADAGALGYLTNPKVRGVLKTTPKFTNTGIPIWDKGESAIIGEVNGYRAGATNQVPSTLTKGSATSMCSAIIYGNWADLLIGEFGVLEVIADPYSQKKKGLIEITTFVMVDLGVRHAESFAAMKDALTTGQ